MSNIANFFSLRRIFVEVRTYENYANIPLRYSIDRFHNSQRGSPLDPLKKIKGITMSKFIRYEDKYINLDFVNKVQMKKDIDNIYYIEMYLSNSQSPTVQITTKEEAKAKAIFDEIGFVLEAKDLVNSIN